MPAPMAAPKRASNKLKETEEQLIEAKRSQKERDLEDKRLRTLLREKTRKLMEMQRVSNGSVQLERIVTGNMEPFSKEALLIENLHMQEEIHVLTEGKKTRDAEISRLKSSLAEWRTKYYMKPSTAVSSMLCMSHGLCLARLSSVLAE